MGAAPRRRAARRKIHADATSLSPTTPALGRVGAPGAPATPLPCPPRPFAPALRGPRWGPTAFAVPSAAPFGRPNVPTLHPAGKYHAQCLANAQPNALGPLRPPRNTFRLRWSALFASPSRPLARVSLLRFATSRSPLLLAHMPLGPATVLPCFGGWCPLRAPRPDPTHNRACKPKGVPLWVPCDLI